MDGSWDRDMAIYRRALHTVVAEDSLAERDSLMADIGAYTSTISLRDSMLDHAANSWC